MVWGHTHPDPPTDLEGDIIAYHFAEQSQDLVRASTGSMPAVSGNLVVWQDYRNGNWDVYGYDLAAQKELPVCVAAGDQTRPDISGDVVVWEHTRNGNADMYGIVLNP